MEQNNNENCDESQESESAATHTQSSEIEVLNTEISRSIVQSPAPPLPFNLASAISYYSKAITPTNVSVSPILIMNRVPSLIIRSPILTPQHRVVRSDLQSLSSFVNSQPQTLFQQAFAKLNESSISNAISTYHRNLQLVIENSSHKMGCIENTELSTPDSLNSAPPSYSFVLRQLAVRRRPRIVGTFIPSPSFVQHTPPPNYAAAFDIYVDNPLPPQPARLYNFGFTSIPVACPDCGYTGLTIVSSRITMCTHLCAVVLCLLCCWICAPLPYILKSCKDVYHYCRNCRSFLGMYCPTNPENSF